MMNTKKILVVSSDLQFMKQCAQRATGKGIAVEQATSAEESLVLIRAIRPEIVLVGDDINGISHVELAKRLRGSVPSEVVPIVVVGLNKKAIEHSILGNQSLDSAQRRQLESPVDSSQPSAASSAAAIAETVAVANGTADASNLTCHDVRLDRRKHRVWVDDRAVRLTPTEFKLLWELASRPGYVLSRQELSERCRRNDRSIQTRTVDAHIKSIRRKLQSRSELIETVHGVGYRFLDTDMAREN
ncbi:MAG: winged-helix domain-containing protein [Planctomycetales bacterium]|nr:winged-helix domain-containing protein [Planctomycetales bacterium]